MAVFAPVMAQNKKLQHLIIESLTSAEESTEFEAAQFASRAFGQYSFEYCKILQETFKS